MRHIIVLLFVALTASSCSKGDLAIVEKYVSDIKAERYDMLREPPPFNKNHIDALLRHASDEQLVSKYPRPPYSSYYAGPIEVGFVLLYAIESIRQQRDWPFLGVRIYDIENLERTVSLSEVLPLYQAWWAAHRGKSATQLGQLDPLEGTDLRWF